MIFGISGRIGSGKDLVALIWRELALYGGNIPLKRVEEYRKHYKETGLIKDMGDTYNWEVRKFALKLKQVCSLLTGIPVEDFEKQEVKDWVLGEEWTRYAYAHGFSKDSDGNTTMLATDCDRERYEQEFRINHQTAYKMDYKVRTLLQRVGTDAMRNVVHKNVWVNALFADYKPDQGLQYPNWLITDTRFLNEVKSIKDHGGFVIRIKRTCKACGELYEKHLGTCPLFMKDEHVSETELDDYKFDDVIHNDGDIYKLVFQVKQLMVKYKVL